MVTKNTILQLGILCLLLSFTSCISTKIVYSGLTEKSASLIYLHDSPIAKHQSNISVAIQPPQYSNNALLEVSQLQKTNTTLIPLIIYNELKLEFTYTLGQSILQEDILPFVHNNLIGSSYRNGVFSIDSLSNSDFTLEVTIDSLSATGPYTSTESGMYAVLTYITVIQEEAGPGEAYSRFTYRLQKKGETILEETVESKRSIAPVVNERYNIPKLRTDYTTQLAESLSLTLKENIDHIVTRINEYVYAQYSSTSQLNTLTEQELEARRSFRINPQKRAKVVVYYPANNHHNYPLPVMWNDSTLAMLTPGTYQVLSVPVEPIRLCTSQQICKKIEPSIDNTTYLVLSALKDEQSVRTDMRSIKSKRGRYQIQKLRKMTNEGNSITR
ncbi:MAG: hypothetical protein AAF944_29005 [Bacteroidota bacterium]